jgi:hypothetical protein
MTSSIMSPSNRLGAQPLRWAVVWLAVGVLLVPSLLVRHGPETVRLWILSLSHGEWPGLGTGDRFLRFDSQYQDLGPMSQSRAVEFSFENRGDQPVVITRTWSSCGCLKVETPTGPIGPGERDKVVVHVFTGEQPPGSKLLLAKVFTNLDPKRPFLLAAEVKFQ